MSPTYRKRLERKRMERSRLGVEARARNRLARAVAAEVCGTVTFSGPMFGIIPHVIRCLDCNDGRHVYLEVDGNAFGRPKSWQGIISACFQRG